MRVAIFGTGALAMLFGARLSLAGARVTLAGSWLACLAAIRRHGIALSSAAGGSPTMAPADVVDLATALPPRTESAELVLVLVKSHQTANVAEHAHRALVPGGSMLTLQNGLGNIEILRRTGSGRAVQGVTSQGAAVLGAGAVRDGGDGVTALPASEQSAARFLRAAGFECELERDLEPRLWLKLAVNCAINPLSARERVPNGRLLESAVLRETMAAAAREAGRLAEARGVELPVDPALEAARVAFRTAANRSSMLQDLDRGARTEIDAISGAVVEEARAFDLPTPINLDLWRTIRALEREPRHRRHAGGCP